MKLNLDLLFDNANTWFHANNLFLNSIKTERSQGAFPGKFLKTYNLIIIVFLMHFGISNYQRAGGQSRNI